MDGGVGLCIGDGYIGFDLVSMMVWVVVVIVLFIGLVLIGVVVIW